MVNIADDPIIRDIEATGYPSWVQEDPWDELNELYGVEEVYDGWDD